MSVNDENILEIEEADQRKQALGKQKGKATNNRSEKGKAKAKDDGKNRGKEKKVTSKSNETSESSKGKPKRRSSVASIVKDDGEETEKKPARKPEIHIAHLPDGQIGSLVVYKSGKVKFRFGKVLMDVSLPNTSNVLCYFSFSNYPNYTAGTRLGFYVL
jgi:hypothetical protein